jgi:hypothetical protein
MDDSESSTRGSFRCKAGKCCLPLRPVVFYSLLVAATVHRILESVVSFFWMDSALLPSRPEAGPIE